MTARLVRTSLLAVIAFTILCGMIYPLFITGIAQLVFPDKSSGSLIQIQGRTVGSVLIGQTFGKPGYFYGRPSATDPPYNAGGSGGSNLGPTNAELIKKVTERVAKIRLREELPADAGIPADLVTASASGLDPHISVDAARLQIRRVARERKIDPALVERLIERHVERPLLGIWGNARVNVLKLNLELDGNQS